MGIRELIKYLIISFFFISFFIFIILLFFEKDLDLVVSLVNNFAVSQNVTDNNQEITFNDIEKRLATYPKYGSVWATIKLPDISVEAPVYQGDSLSIMKYGIGHYTGSYFPKENGSIILAGHNSEEYFKKLPDLAIGSKIIIEATYGTFTYQIYDTKIISDKDTASLPIQHDEERLMIYTCYPVNSLGYKNKRYVVYAKLIAENEVG